MGHLTHGTEAGGKTYDLQHGDRFCFKAGGDGDNGELILVYLDEWFALAERDAS